MHHELVLSSAKGRCGVCATKISIGKEGYIPSLLKNALMLAKTDFNVRIACLYMFCLNAWPIDVVVNKQAWEKPNADGIIEMFPPTTVPRT